MDRVRNVGIAAVLASLAGGPLLAVMAGIGVLLSGDPVHFDPHLMLAALGVIAMMTFFGWFVAIIPNLLGTSVLGWLGRDNVGMRLPAIWAVVGAATTGIPAWLLSGSYGYVETTAVMAGVGALSALLCRAKVRWAESADQIDR